MGAVRRYNPLMRTSVVFLLAASLQAAGVPTIDESLSMKSVSAPQISPDGRYVAYHVTSANWEENEFVTQIWVASMVTGERYQLTSGKKSATGPQWSPDSKRIAFVSDRDGKRQIYLISPAGGEAAPLTAEEGGVSSIAWSPDGTSIAFTSTGADSKARKDRKEKYGDFEIVGGDYTMSHLWRVKVPEEIPADPKKLPKAEQLTSGEQFTVGAFSWSPDGQRIAFAAQRDPDLGSSDTQQLYVLDLADLHVRKLLNGNGPNGNPKWSPDGRQIAYVTANGSPSYYYTNGYIASIPYEGGTPTLLTSDFDEDPNLVAWGPDGIYFTAQQKTASQIFQLDPATKKVHRISAPADFSAGSPTFTKDFRTMTATGAAPNHFTEVFTSPVAAFSPHIRTDVAAQYKDFHLGTREVVQWKSSDGTTIEGILIKPADYDPARKYPLLVVIHGGPTGVDTPLLARRPNLPGRALRRQGRADSETELSRQRRVRRQVSRAQCTQPGRGRLRRRHQRRRFPDRPWHRGQGPRRQHGMEPGRIHFRLHHLLQRSLQSRQCRRRHLRLDDLLRQYRHPPLHPPVFESHSVGRSRDLPQNQSDYLRQSRPHADPDPARRPGQARAAAQCLRTLPGASRPQRSGKTDPL